MSDILYLDFLREVVPFVPDVPEPVAVHAVRQAIIDLCDQSHVWVHEADPFDLIAGENAYQIDVPRDTTIAIIREIYINGRRIDPFLPDQLRDNPGGIDWRTLRGTPTLYTHQEPATLILCPVPVEDAEEAGKAIVALKPTRASQRVSDVLLERWGEGIGLGARARLYEYPGVHQDLGLAAAYHKRFNSVISEAKRTAYKGHTRAAAQVAIPRIV